jgi:hypothetical protein
MTLSDIDDSIHDKSEREKRLFIKHFDDLVVVTTRMYSILSRTV